MHVVSPLPSPRARARRRRPLVAWNWEKSPGGIVGGAVDRIYLRVSVRGHGCDDSDGFRMINIVACGGEGRKGRRVECDGEGGDECRVQARADNKVGVGHVYRS